MCVYFICIFKEKKTCTNSAISLPRAIACYQKCRFNLITCNYVPMMSISHRAPLFSGGHWHHQVGPVPGISMHVPPFSQLTEEQYPVISEDKLLKLCKLKQRHSGLSDNRTMGKEQQIITSACTAIVACI